MAENKLLDGKIPLYVNGSAIRFNTRLIDSDIFTLLRLPVQGYMLSAELMIDYTTQALFKLLGISKE